MMETPVSNDRQSVKSASPFQDSEADERFSAVLSEINLAQLPSLARSIRIRNDDLLYDDEEPMIDNPIFGSCHVLFPIRFNDGVSLIAKFPHNGTKAKWDRLSAMALFTEVNTMRLLKQETTIPLPKVFQFSSKPKNCLRCPYIIMENVTGRSLYDVWFGHRLGNASWEAVMQHREKALSGIATAMAQLDKFSFDQGGSLIFEAPAEPCGVGPVRSLDYKAMLDRWVVHEDPSDDPIYVMDDVAYGTKSFYLRPLARDSEDQPFPRGLWVLLHLLINEIEEPTSDKPFVLTHPDFDIHNFIVADDGQLLSIIDWNGVATVPRSVGNLRYPSWLTRDWNPAMYTWDESMESGVEPQGIWEDSPDELARCRTLYRDIMSWVQEDDFDEILTHMSLITENLAIAAYDPRSRNNILRKIVYHMSENQWMYNRNIDFTQLVNDLGENKLLTKGEHNKLQNGFRHLLLLDNL
ncbi:hypothetical protein GGR53DRAFT_518061 [Hypoxylon sp. FL1150]|nr:hypothetical protein GGR53DRAFT_518061 [Hypoxylon sp. FL1150]